MSSLPDEKQQQPFWKPKNHSPKVGDKARGINQVFQGLNRKFEEQETQRRAKDFQLPYFALAGFPIEQGVLAIISEEQARSARAIPFFKEGSLLRLAVAEPANPALQTILSDLAKEKYQVELYLVSQSSLDLALQQYQKTLHPVSGLKPEVAISTGAAIVERLQSLGANGKSAVSLSASELLNLILGAAATMHASDIHLEPEKHEIKVRFRIDGVLQDIVLLPISFKQMLLSRIKLLANLKLNVTTVPQDGRLTIKLTDHDLDLRVSSLPAAYGESIAMRILGIQDIGFDIEKLGLRGLGLEVIYEELKKPNGMILTTGPTGCGKTTTLYAFLNYLNRPGIKIITIEDPVEYQLEGIIQTPVNYSAGMDFVKVLRSVLRQDPDILMVGEIRDFETGETACQAALTGHMVFSTLHTNDAAGAIPRLLDLGIKPVTLAPALNALIAQRLLRRICQHCQEPTRPTFEELRRVRQILSQIPNQAKVSIPTPLTFYHSRGCAECHNLSYEGRIGVFEVFVVNDRIESLIFQQASTVEIKKAAVAQGMFTMQQDAILKALQGITDLAEVWRVTEE